MDTTSFRRYVASELHRLHTAVGAGPELSLVVPVYDEESNLDVLYTEVCRALAGREFELVLVDDGSRDDSADRIRALHLRDPRVRGVFLTRNRGQSAALAVGVHAAVGRLIVTLDADLQNDPADIPRLVAALGEHTAVVGYRHVRKDSLGRRLCSRFANAIRNGLTRDQVRDSCCALRVIRSEAARALPWFDGTHRFVPTLLRMQGGSVVEVAVSHRPRVAGVSKYGVRNRAWRALRDTLAVRWMATRAIAVEVAAVDPLPRSERPRHGELSTR